MCWPCSKVFHDIVKCIVQRLLLLKGAQYLQSTDFRGEKITLPLGATFSLHTLLKHLNNVGPTPPIVIDVPTYMYI